MKMVYKSTLIMNQIKPLPNNKTLECSFLILLMKD